MAPIRDRQVAAPLKQLIWELTIPAQVSIRDRQVAAPLKQGISFAGSGTGKYYLSATVRLRPH